MRRGLYIDWKSAGAQLATEDDESQAAFLDGMLTEMLRWDSSLSREMQLTYVAKLLSKEQRELLACACGDCG